VLLGVPEQPFMTFSSKETVLTEFPFIHLFLEMDYLNMALRVILLLCSVTASCKRARVPDNANIVNICFVPSDRSILFGLVLT